LKRFGFVKRFGALRPKRKCDGQFAVKIFQRLFRVQPTSSGPPHRTQQWVGAHQTLLFVAHQASRIKFGTHPTHVLRSRGIDKVPLRTFPTPFRVAPHTQVVVRGTDRLFTGFPRSPNFAHTFARGKITIPTTTAIVGATFFLSASVRGFGRVGPQ
jgi:hypothetical protein